MERISADVTEAVRVAADAARGYPGTLADVHRRARRRRNRQAALSAAAVVVLLAGIGVAARREAPVPVDPAVAVVAPYREAQRLMMDGAAGTYRMRDGRTVRLGAGAAIGEYLPDGEVLAHEVPGSRSWDRAIGLPDGAGGGLVALGSDGTLVAAENGGRGVWADRDVRRSGEAVSMLTATVTTAYLWRPAGVVAHDLATGTEKPVIPAGALGVTEVSDGSIRAADLAGDRLAVVRGQDDCAVSIVDVPSGAESGRLSADVRDCGSVTAVRLSPDGSAVAVVSQIGSTTIHTATGGPLALFGVDVLRVADGTVLARGSAVTIDPGTGADSGAGRPEQEDARVAVAWRDDHTLRGVVYPAGGGAEPYLLNEINMTW